MGWWHKQTRASRVSLIACLAAFALSVLSMGVLGALLYFISYPVIVPLFGPVDGWSPDWVWGSMILSAMVWSLSFLVAGGVYNRLTASGLAKGLRITAYLAVLWGGAVVSWLLVLTYLTST